MLDLILRIIESPLSEKNYKDLKKYYENAEMFNEAKAIEDLINVRFHKNNNSSLSKKQ